MQGLDGGSTPWWGKTHLRLIVLLVLLGGVAAYGVPTIVTRANGARGPIWCRAVRIPAQPMWSLAKLKAVVAESNLPELIGGGTPANQGLQIPDAAWTDRYPWPPKSTPDPAMTPGGAGYEIAWWSSDNDHQGAELFDFSTVSGAAAYVRTAATANCRRHATLYTLNRPEGARAVVWINPVNVLEADVIVARGTRVYITFEVPPIGVHLPTPQLLAIPANIACQIRELACSQ